MALRPLPRAAEASKGAPGAKLAALRRLRDLSLGRARRIVVPSRYLAERAIGWGLDREKVEVLVNPAPPPLAVQPESLGPRTLVFAGRLTPPKALPVLLDALALVPDAELIIVGDGEERGLLERRIRDLQLGPRVRLVGSRPRDEVLRYLAGARRLSSRAPGRTCRMQRSKRSQSARPSSRQPSAECPRSYTTT